jgi:hypothetical protein
MTSRIAFAASSLVIASLLILASGCSNEVTLPTDGSGGSDNGGTDNGGSSGDTTGTGNAPFSRGDFDCPNTLVNNICQPTPPQASAATDCPAGVQEGVCLAVAPASAAALDCAPTAPRDGLCDPAPAVFTNWTCPGGSAQVPGISDANGGTLSVANVAGFTACVPTWAENCPADTTPRLGVAGCSAILPSGVNACPTDWPTEDQLRANNPGFATDTVANKIVYVDPAIVPGSNGACGARTAPCANPGEAVSVGGAGDNDIIALKVGTYTLGASFTISTHTAIAGACTSGTRLSSAASDTLAVINLQGPGARIADLTLTGDSPGVAVASGIDGASVERVQIVQARSNAITLEDNAHLTLTNSLISGTRTSSTGTVGIGLNIAGGSSSVTLSGVAFTGNHTAAINVTGSNSSIDASDLLVLDTSAGTSGGEGLVLSAGTAATLTRAAFARNTDAAVLAQGAQTQASLTDTYITGTVAGGSGTKAGGAAAYALGGAEVDTERLMATANVVGLRATGAGTTLHLADTVISGSVAGSATNSGTAIWADGGVNISGQAVTLLRNAAGLFESGGTLQLTNLVVAGSTGAGVSTSGTDVQLTGVALSGNATGLSLGATSTFHVADAQIVDGKKQGSTPAYAVYIDSSQGSFERLSLARNDEYGLFVSGASAQVDATDLRVGDTHAVADSGKTARGIGVTVTDPSGAPTLGLSRAIIDQSQNYGLLVSAPGAAVTLQDVTVSNTQAVQTGRSGGILLLNDTPTQATASLDLTRVLIDGNADTGFAASGTTSQITLQDVAISNTAAGTNPDLGGALFAYAGASLIGQRVTLTRNAHGGVGVDGTGTDVELSDLLVADTSAGSGSTPSGEGLEVVTGKAVLNGASLVRNAAAAVWAAQGADVEINDTVIADTAAAPPDSGIGIGIELIGAKLVGTGVSVARSAGLGISAALGSDLTLTDLSISATNPAPSLAFGRALEVTSGSSATLTRADIADSRDYAVFVSGPDATSTSMLEQYPRAAGALPSVTSLVFDDSSIHNTQSAACVDSSCGSSAGGGGIGALSGASLNLDTFDIRSNTLVGLQLLEGATLVAARGLLTSNAVGVNLQSSSIDLTKSLTDVTVSKNKTDNATQNMPAPVASDLLGRSAGRLDMPAIPSPR